MNFPRFSLFNKIILWFFLNLILIIAILFLFGIGLRVNFIPNKQIEPVILILQNEMEGKSKDERNQIIQNYSLAYKLDFYVFDKTTQQLYGNKIELPEAVKTEILEHLFPPRLTKDFNSNQFFDERKYPIGLGPVFSVTSANPTTYWWGTTLLLVEKNNPQVNPSILIIKSDSPIANGFFPNTRPWFYAILTIIFGSALFWFPFVRNLNKSISEMQTATNLIADEKFDVEINEKRNDELGTLGKSINRLSKRLAEFVYGQKRFLGDVSHELNSPLARMQFAVSILESKVDKKNQVYINDLKEEITLMTNLVNELLTFTKTGIKTKEIILEEVLLKPLIEKAIAQEAKNDEKITLEIAETLLISANSEMLFRASVNVLRNAIRYASEAGEIKIIAKENENYTEISFLDNGNGVPENMLEQIFEPFYRVDKHRSRQSGGTGLGLAIVKTCVENCQGKVFAKNHQPRGFEVLFIFPKIKKV